MLTPKRRLIGERECLPNETFSSSDWFLRPALTPINEPRRPTSYQVSPRAAFSSIVNIRQAAPDLGTTSTQPARSRSSRRGQESHRAEVPFMYYVPGRDMPQPPPMPMPTPIPPTSVQGDTKSSLPLAILILMISTSSSPTASACFFISEIGRPAAFPCTTSVIGDFKPSTRD